MVGNALQHVAQIGLRGESVQLGGSYQAIEGCGTISAAIRSREQVVLSAQCDSPDILPMSVKNWRFTIVGTRFMGVRFAIEIANNAAVGVLST